MNGPCIIHLSPDGLIGQFCLSDMLQPHCHDTSDQNKAQSHFWHRIVAKLIVVKMESYTKHVKLVCYFRDSLFVITSVRFAPVPAGTQGIPEFRRARDWVTGKQRTIVPVINCKQGGPKLTQLVAMAKERQCQGCIGSSRQALSPKEHSSAQ